MIRQEIPTDRDIEHGRGGYILSALPGFTKPPTHRRQTTKHIDIADQSVLMAVARRGRSVYVSSILTNNKARNDQQTTRKRRLKPIERGDTSRNATQADAPEDQLRKLELIKAKYTDETFMNSFSKHRHDIEKKKAMQTENDLPFFTFSHYEGSLGQRRNVLTTFENIQDEKREEHIATEIKVKAQETLFDKINPRRKVGFKLSESLDIESDNSTSYHGTGITYLPPIKQEKTDTHRKSILKKHNDPIEATLPKSMNATAPMLHMPIANNMDDGEKNTNNDDFLPVTIIQGTHRVSKLNQPRRPYYRKPRLKSNDLLFNCSQEFAKVVGDLDTISE